MRQPRRKKNKFEFKITNVPVIVKQGTNAWFKAANEITYVGEFGYHNVNVMWTVIHIPTGLDLYYCNEEKSARIAVKKLISKMPKDLYNWDVSWSASGSALRLINMALKASEILKTNTPPFIPLEYEFNHEDDIPF